MPDQYTRTRAQLGTPALDVLRRAHVAVFGIGGVGGQAVEVLARSGVGELRLGSSLRRDFFQTEWAEHLR